MPKVGKLVIEYLPEYFSRLVEEDTMMGPWKRGWKKKILRF